MVAHDAAPANRAATEGADDPAFARFAPRVASTRIRAIVDEQTVPTIWGAVVAYWRLQPGRWWEWLAIWALQNSRHAPVYLFPLLSACLIDRIDPAHPERALVALPWVLAGTFLLCFENVITTTLGQIIMSRLRRTLTAGLRRALVARLNRLTFAFHDRAKAGELQNKFTLDMGRLESMQYFLAESLAMQGTTIMVMMVIMFFRNPLMLLVIALAVPLNLAVARVLWRPINRTNAAFRRAESHFLANLTETLFGIRLSRAHATEDVSEERVSGAAGRVAQRGMQLDIITSLFGSSSWAVSSFLHMAVVGLGVVMAVKGPFHWDFGLFTCSIPRPTLGDLTVMLTYYGLTAGAISHILNGLPSLAATNDTLRSLAGLYRTEDEEDDSGKPPLVPVTGDIRLENVVFIYPNAENHSLDGIDLHVPAGSSLALVGPSGSGKSTIASLILGFYQPQRGRILLDDRDLRDLDLRSVRRQVGVVSQDVVLFRDSILENIAWGAGRPDRKRAQRAAELANALPFVRNLRGGFDHLLKDRGGGLSGGQRQRLAIARALYRDPRLLILDEATSALDPESERLVQQALEELMRGRTTLIIAHRLSTVRHADRIAVLDHGRVVEIGTYESLMANEQGAFRKLAVGQLV